jgi:hypothetical protein
LPLPSPPTRHRIYIAVAVAAYRAANFLPSTHVSAAIPAAVAANLLPPTHRLCIQDAAAIAAACTTNFLPPTYVAAAIPAAIADDLLPPTHPHRRRCRIYIAAVIAAYRAANFFPPTPLHCFYRPIYRGHPQNQSKCILLPPNAQFHQKYTKKIAPNAPEHTAVVCLHYPVSLNAIGVLKCTLFVSLITQISHCIFLLSL